MGRTASSFAYFLFSLGVSLLIFNFVALLCLKEISLNVFNKDGFMKGQINKGSSTKMTGEVTLTVFIDEDSIIS